MTFDKTPSGTRGGRGTGGSGPVVRFVGRAMMRQHRRRGDRFMGMDLLYLTTVGAKSGEKRVTPVSRFTDGEGAWLIVASAGGAARHPGWYHNIAAHPDQIWVEVAGQTHHVRAEQLTGERRDEAWRRITASQPRYAGYQRKTDRELPIIRLSIAD
jgi:deazaflavin-dependent oxidoreductase (nitroreductase family)